jgi:hypothetical protein
MVKKQNRMIELMKQVRNSWQMNPRTRVQENEIKNKKKRRQEEKKLNKEEY